jgi:adenylate cyclase
LFSILGGLRLFHQFRLELTTARQLAEQLVSLAEQLNNPAKLAVAHGALGSCLLWMGEVRAAHQHLERMKHATSSIEGGFGLEARDYDQVAATLSLLAWALDILGFFDQATKESQAALAWALGLSRLSPLLIASVHIGHLDQVRGDAQAAHDHSATVLSIATEYQFRQHVSSATVIQGWVRSCGDDAESGIAEMRRGLAEAEAEGMRTPSFLRIPLAEAYLRIGRFEEADRLLAALLETVQQTGHRLQEAELYRFKGELLLKTSRDEPQAEAYFRQAIKIAQCQSARWWELRVTMSLARLLARQGRRDEARTILAEIYNWFTEGFDTADLKDAQALLDELSE